MKALEIGRVVAGDMGKIRFPHHRTTVNSALVRRVQPLAADDPKEFIEALRIAAGPAASDGDAS